MNCIDNECKNEYSHFGESYCALTKKEVPDNIDITECNNFAQAHTCINCKFSTFRVYETGTIDEVDYKCPFQNNEIIYQDLNPCSFHFSDVPECPIIDKFELIRQ